MDKEKNNLYNNIVEQNYLDHEVEEPLKNSLKKHEEILNSSDIKLAKYDDYSFFDNGQKLKKIQELEDLINTLKNYIPNPYFGRIQIKDKNGELQNLYIAKKDLFISQDDTSPLIRNVNEKGNKYGESFETKKKLSDDIVSITNVSIENEQIQSAVTTYFDSGTERIEGNYDEYLIKVISRKRNLNLPTNIYASIQQKQADIVYEDENKSFIVQGCAGSGKSVVLIHRLKYFLYNNSSFSYKLITPSHSFNKFISPLIEDIGIEKLKMSTFSEFYDELIHSFVTKFYVDSESQKQNTRLTKYRNHCNETNKFILQKALGNYKMPSEFILKIYSDTIKESITKYYNHKLKLFFEDKDLNAFLNIIDYKINSKLFDNNIVIKLNTLLQNKLFYHQSQLKKYNEKINRINNAKKDKNPKVDIDKLEQERDELKLTLLTDSQIELFNKCTKILYNLSFEKLYSNIIKRFIVPIEKEYNVNNSQNTYEYHKYIALLLISLHCKKQKTLIPKHLFIDEAQTLFPNEYQLLRDILDKKTVFNLYGDTNQLKIPNIGTSEWADIPCITNNIKVLDTNYRNTSQIVNFCNKQFDTSIDDFGINGEEVELLNGIDDYNKIISYYHTHPKERILIISKDLSLIKKLKSLSPKLSLSNEIENGKICIMNLDSVQGVEADCVLVATKNMTKGEKYISFTRGLKKLFVLN